MDFFEHQERARRNTLLLAFIFAVAVVLIILSVYLVLALIFIANRPAPAAGAPEGMLKLWDAGLFMGTIIATLTIIASGTIYKMLALSAGGEAVARIFGATLVNPGTAAPTERRLLNVVEEMAIASGMPIPRVYLLADDSINAFAAGFSTRDAVIGVTHGCMNLLSRDELQSVIAHEFSHILNGDMRLNIRLMGVLHGILIISLIGYWTFRIATQSSSRGIGGAARRKGGNTLPFLLAGLCVMIIGYIGVFFARLIKSAVSRQREFLADAASVQFTRNPEGMTGALKKIGGCLAGSHINHPSAEEASHLFFADGLKRSFFGLMATHPPLIARIRRIDPDFNGTFPAISRNIMPMAGEGAGEDNPMAANLAGNVRTGNRLMKFDPGQTSSLVGRPDAERLSYVGKLLAVLPPRLRAATRDRNSAAALIMAMLISRDKTSRDNQLLYIRGNASPEIYQKVIELLPVVEKSPPEWFLPLADLSLAGLRVMPKSDLNTFRSHLKRLAEADGAITLPEYMLQCMVGGYLRSWTDKDKQNSVKSADFSRYRQAVLIVLSTLAYYGNGDDLKAALAFAEGAKLLPIEGNAQIFTKEQCGLRQVDAALSELAAASAGIKKQFLDACSACAASDGQISITEAELLRAVAATVDCPFPPFLPSGS